MPTPDTSQEKLFALSFLTRKDGEPSLMDYVLINQKLEEGMMMTMIPRLEEMRQIGLIVGNFALDGISARELLTCAMLESSYIDKFYSSLQNNNCQT